MKLSLRDLFWLLVIAAIATCWGLERTKASKRLAELGSNAWASVRVRDLTPSAGSLSRTATLRELRGLSKSALIERTKKAPPDSPFGDATEYSCCLTEMARRRMQNELGQLYEAQGENKGSDLLLLTALRRAQRRSDPLKIHVEVAQHDRDGKAVDFPLIVAMLQNVDTETLGYFDGGDYRSGRRERWRVQLTDMNGHQVADSNFLSFIGGGLGGGRELKPGEKLETPFHLDARSFVKPPDSGRYMLQVVHSENYIADEPDLAGLIVWKSEPVAVIVQNAGTASYTVTAIPLLSIIVAGVVFMAWNRRRAYRSEGTEGVPHTMLRSWRTWAPAVLALASIAGWLADSYYLRKRILHLQPDAEAVWMMRSAG